MSKPVSSVPLLDLKRQYAPIKEQVMNAIAEVVDSTQFIQGPKVENWNLKLQNIVEPNMRLASLLGLTPYSYR